MPSGQVPRSLMAQEANDGDVGKQPQDSQNGPFRRYISSRSPEDVVHCSVDFFLWNTIKNEICTYCTAVGDERQF